MYYDSIVGSFPLHLILVSSPPTPIFAYSGYDYFCKVKAAKYMYVSSVADLVGVRVVRLNPPPLEPNYFNFMGKFTKNLGQYLKTNPLLMDLNHPSRNPGSAPVLGSFHLNFYLLRISFQIDVFVKKALNRSNGRI